MNDDPVIPINPSSAARRKPSALGRGLEALLGESRREEPLVSVASLSVGAKNHGGLAMLALTDIEPHPDQPRRYFDEASLEELAASIAVRGVIQPVIVRPHPEQHGRYQLVAGERRWRAAGRAQLHEIPALVRQLGDRDVMALALIENLQREDLNPIEEARAYQRLTDDEGMTQADLARLVDKSRSHVANIQRLLALPEPVIARVESGELSMGHARALIGASDADMLATRILDGQLSVRQTEAMVRQQGRGGTTGQRRARNDASSAETADIAVVQRQLEELLGMSVKIAADHDPRSGSVTIRYRTLDQLDLVCQRLTGSHL